MVVTLLIIMFLSNMINYILIEIICIISRNIAKMFLSPLFFLRRSVGSKESYVSHKKWTDMGRLTNPFIGVCTHHVIANKWFYEHLSRYFARTPVVSIDSFTKTSNSLLAILVKYGESSLSNTIFSPSRTETSFPLIVESNYISSLW